MCKSQLLRPRIGCVALEVAGVDISPAEALRRASGSAAASTTAWEDLPQSGLNEALAAVAAGEGLLLDVRSAMEHRSQCDFLPAYDLRPRWLLCNHLNHACCHVSPLPQSARWLDHAPHCRALHPEADHMPLNTVDADSMAAHKGRIVFVLDTGDLRGRQACVRFSKVLGFEARLVTS
jgi:hypothetical protein